MFPFLIGKVLTLRDRIVMLCDEVTDHSFPFLIGKVLTGGFNPWFSSFNRFHSL